MGGYAAPPGGGEWSFGGQSGNTTTGANNSGYAGAVQAANPGQTSVAPSGSYGGSSGSSGSTISNNTPQPMTPSTPAVWISPYASIQAIDTTPTQSYAGSTPYERATGQTYSSSSPSTSPVEAVSPNYYNNSPAPSSAVDGRTWISPYASVGTISPEALVPQYSGSTPYERETGQQYISPTFVPFSVTQIPYQKTATDNFTSQAIAASLTRPDYYTQSSLGDTATQNYIKQGYTTEQALNMQLIAALKTPSTYDEKFYKNELEKSLGSNIAVASQYHSLSMKSGLPTAPNPYANVADLSLYALKGTNGKDASFSPTDFTQLGLIGGKGIQEGALNVTNAIDIISKAKVSGDVGLYNSQNLKSYSSTYGVLDLATQQAITTKAAKSAGSEGWVTDPTLLTQLPTQKEFGYGTGGFKPSYIQDNLQATSPVPNMVSTERVLGSYASAYDTKGNFSPSMTLLGAGVKLTDAQASALDSGFGTAKQSADDYFKSIPSGAVPVKSQNGLYFTSISKMETPVAPEKNFVDKGLDIAGGFVRSVGGMTEVLGAPNIVDVVVKAKPALQYVPVLGTALYSPIGIGTVAGREGAQEMKGGSIYSRGEPLKYGEYSAAGREFSKNVIQPITGVSPEQYEGYVKQAEIDYNRKDATFTDKSIAALSMVGNTAKAWVVGKPDEVLTVGTQAAAIEVTGAFGLIGKGAEYSLTKVAQVGKVAESPIVRSGINVVGKYGVDVAFGAGVVGEVTRGESVQTYGMDAGGKQYLISDKEGEWFGVRTVPQLAKNVGLTGAQLVVFTGGMYGAGSIGGGAKTGGGETTSAFKEGAPYQPKYTSPTGNTGGSFEGKTPSGSSQSGSNTKGNYGSKSAAQEAFDKVDFSSPSGEYNSREVSGRVVKSTIELLRAEGKYTPEQLKAIEKRLDKQGGLGGGGGSYTDVASIDALAGKQGNTEWQTVNLNKGGKGLSRNVDDIVFGGMRDTPRYSRTVAQENILKDLLRIQKEYTSDLNHPETAYAYSSRTGELIGTARGESTGSMSFDAVETMMYKANKAKQSGEPIEIYHTHPYDRYMYNELPLDLKGREDFHDMYNKPSRADLEFVYTNPQVSRHGIVTPDKIISYSQSTIPSSVLDVYRSGTRGRTNNIINVMRDFGMEPEVITTQNSLVIPKEMGVRKLSGNTYEGSLDTSKIIPERKYIYSSGTGKVIGEVTLARSSINDFRTEPKVKTNSIEILKEKGVKKYSRENTDIVEYKKGITDMELYRRPVTDITKFKPRPTEITPTRKNPTDIIPRKDPFKEIVQRRTPTDITPYRKPIVDITPYRRPPTDIVPKRPTPTDIVKYKDPITDVTPYKKPPTEIVKYKDPFKDIVPRPRDDIVPRREEPAPKEKKLEKGGGGLPPTGLPFGGFGGGGGSSGGGGARGGRHSTDIFKYGFGISGEIGIQVPKTKRGKK